MQPCFIIRSPMGHKIKGVAILMDSLNEKMTAFAQARMKWP